MKTESELIWEAYQSANTPLPNGFTYSETYEGNIVYKPLPNARGPSPRPSTDYPVESAVEYWCKNTAHGYKTSPDLERAFALYPYTGIMYRFVLLKVPLTSDILSPNLAIAEKAIDEEIRSHDTASLPRSWCKTIEGVKEFQNQTTKTLPTPTPGHATVGVICIQTSTGIDTEAVAAKVVEEDWRLSGPPKGTPDEQMPQFAYYPYGMLGRSANIGEVIAKYHSNVQYKIVGRRGVRPKRKFSS